MPSNVFLDHISNQVEINSDPAPNVLVDQTVTVTEIDQSVYDVIISPIGMRGPAGPGVPSGGLTGQALVKNSDTSYDTEWVTFDPETVWIGTDPPGTGDYELWVDTDETYPSPIPAGGTAGQALVKTTSTDYDISWGNVALVYSGTPDPEAAVTAPPGAVYTQSTGKVWVKHSGTSNTGWVQVYPPLESPPLSVSTTAPVTPSKGDLWVDVSGLGGTGWPD